MIITADGENSSHSVGHSDSPTLTTARSYTCAVSVAGHLKFVDFGTAKDYIQTDLNGPEFVGKS